MLTYIYSTHKHWTTVYLKQQGILYTVKPGTFTGMKLLRCSSFFLVKL